MGKIDSYSVELRERVLKVRKELGLTYEQTAELFDVGEATVNRWERLRRETGKLERRKRGPGATRLLRVDHLPRLQQLVEEKPDRTLAELAQVFEQRSQIRLSISTMGRYVRELGMTFKKKSSAPRSVTAKTSRSGVKNIKSR